MIEKISIKNFKNHADTEIELYRIPTPTEASETNAPGKLGRVIALVGPNGAGKSTVLQTVYEFNQLVERIVKLGQWSLEPLSTMVRKQQYEWGICVKGKDDYVKTEWQIQVKTTLLDQSPQYEWILNRRVINDTDANALAAKKKVADLFGQVVYFKAIALSSSRPSYTQDIPPKIGYDGSDVASVISYLKSYQEEIAKRIEDDLKKIVPPVKRVRVHPVSKLVKERRTFSANGNNIAYDEDRQVVAQELVFDMESGNGLPANLMSEGTLVTLALLTLLHTSDASLFLLDDIEQGLHPLAQRKLMQALINFANQHKRQIILTSHSPYIIDELDAKDVLVMATDQEGISHCKRLSDHPDAKRLLEVLTTGELGGAVGEDWVLPKEPVAEVANA